MSVVYVACDDSAQDAAQRHVLLVQQLHPHHVGRLPGQQRLDVKRIQQMKLKMTHVIPMLLSLDSKLCALLLAALSTAPAHLCTDINLLLSVNMYCTAVHAYLLAAVQA